MKILIIGNGYPTKKRPQWGHFERDQALALRNLGHDIAFLYVGLRIRFRSEKLWRRPLKVERREEKGIQIFGVTMFPLSLLKLVNKRTYEFAISRVMNKGLESIIKSIGKPDVMYAHFMFNIAYAAYLKERSGIPLVGMEHWSILTQDNLPKDICRLGNKAYSSVDGLLAVSKSLQAHIFRHFNKESTVVYDMLGQEFVTTDVNQRLKKTPFKFITIGGGKFFFIAIGNLIHRKGFDVLLSAFQKSNLADRGCRIIIVGDGPERVRLEEQAKSLGISDFVKLTGRLTKLEIIDIMSICNAFIMSSRAETFGVVCIEALSQGLPNIATICGGPEEFITRKNGFLIKPDNVECLTDAMTSMFENYKLFNRREIAGDCLSKFSPPVIAKQLETIFKNTINNN